MEKRKELADYVPQPIFDLSYKDRYKEFNDCRQGKYEEWYNGISKIFYRLDQGSLMTTSLNGSFSTINFGKPFDEKTFDRFLSAKLYIFVPDNLRNGSTLFINVDMDIDTEVNDKIRILAYREKTSQKLDGTIRKNHMEFKILNSSLYNKM